MLAAPTIYATARSPHGTTSDRPIPQSSSAKKVVRHCEFSKKFGIWRNIMNQIMQMKMHGFRATLYVCHEMVPSSQRPPEGGCWAPFSCSWGTEGCPTGPRPGARHTLQHGRPPSSGTWGALLFPFGRLAGAHEQSFPCSGRKSYWCWKISERCQLRCRTATVRLLCDAFFFLNGPPPTFRKF
jgi:hypothetical protein